MGAGQFPAGRSPGGPVERSGNDPVYAPTPIVPIAPIVAVEFDPHTRQFVQNADGTLKAVHPVDQQVCLLLWLSQGDIPSAATLGTRIRQRIGRVDRRSIPAICLDEVSQVLRPLVDAGDIVLVTPAGQSGPVIVDTSIPGRTSFAVYYQNLRAADPRRIRRAQGF